MIILLYIILGLILLGGIFHLWFFYIYLTVPKLVISENTPLPEKIKMIDDWLIQLNQSKKFNGAILLAKKGQPLLMQTYGFAGTQNLGKEDKLNQHSSFRLASLSKQFTAAGIMLLNEQKRLDYDDLVRQYIDDFPYPEVTIRHLLNQTSGIPDLYLKLATKHKKSIDILSNEKAVDLIIQHHAKGKLPNEKFEYSNTNYILLARIIELISGQSFEDFMNKNIFQALGMEHTRVWNLLSKEKSFVNKTVGFSYESKDLIKAVEPTFIDGVAGDGGVFSSIYDLLKWDAFWYKNDLISPENLAEAFKKPVLNNGEISKYGFGWMVEKNGQLWHNGSWLAANSMFIRNVDKKTCFVLLDNSTNPFFNKIIKQFDTVMLTGTNS